MHPARATDFFGLNGRVALRRSPSARPHPPSGSPAARARAAAVISESIRIPPHLSLPGWSNPASVFVHGREALGHIEKESRDKKRQTSVQPRNSKRRSQ